MECITSVTGVRVHYRDDGFLMIEATVSVKLGQTIAQAKDVATRARAAVAAAIKGVREADVDIDLDLGWTVYVED